MHSLTLLQSPLSAGSLCTMPVMHLAIMSPSSQFCCLCSRAAASTPVCPKSPSSPSDRTRAVLPLFAWSIIPPKSAGRVPDLVSAFSTTKRSVLVSNRHKSSKRRTPSANTSIFSLTIDAAYTEFARSLPLVLSLSELLDVRICVRGGLYSSVPTPLSEAQAAAESSSAMLPTRPKSPIRAFRYREYCWGQARQLASTNPGRRMESSERNILAGFRTRCTMPAEWRYCTPERMPRNMLSEGLRWKQWRVWADL